MMTLKHNAAPSAGRDVTLDLAGLGPEERKRAGNFAGSKGNEFVRLGDKTIDCQRIGHVVFRWGDMVADETIAELLKNYDPQEKKPPFKMAAVMGDDLWSLDMKPDGYRPDKAYRRSDAYVEVPFNPTQGSRVVEAWSGEHPFPHITALGFVGTRWVTFDQGRKIVGK